ncbi:MAG: substrate-binding domain-containing protein [Lentisphaeria bacterium]
MTSRIKTVYNSRAVRLSQDLLKAMRQGRFAAGELLPPEQELAARYKVSRSTLRRAVEILAAENHLIKSPRRGMVVPSAMVENNGAAARLVAWLTLALSGEADEYARGLQDALAGTPFNLGVYCSQANPARLVQLLEHLTAMRPAGIVLQQENRYGQDPRLEALARALAEAGIPVVRLDSEDHLPLTCDAVHGEPYRIGMIAARYLVAKGYRDVTFLATTTPEDYQEYLAGLRHVLTPAGIPLPDGRTVNFKVPHGYGAAPDPFFDAEEKMRELLAAGFRQGTLLAGHDYVATGVLRVVLAAGLRVPEDVQVISMLRCDVHGATPMRLTTIENHREEKGRLAGRLLLRRIGGHAGPFETVRLAADEIVPGETG